MKLNNRFLITLLLLFTFTISVSAQSSLEDEILLDKKFDGFKALELQYESNTPSDYRLYMDDDRYEKGRTKMLQRFKATTTFPVMAGENYVVSVSGGYHHGTAKFDKIKRQNIGVPTIDHKKNEFLFGYAGAVSMSMHGKLFGKDMVYLGSIITEGSHGIETVSLLGAATIVLKKNETTSLAVGLYGTTSRSQIFPFFPILSYTHRFDSGWTIDTILPQRAHMRRRVGDRGRFSTGFMFDSYTYYMYPRNKQDFPHTYTYNRVDLKVEAIYEHFLTDNIIFKANVGLDKCYEGEVRQKYKRSDIATLKQDANIFSNVSISYKLGK